MGFCSLLSEMSGTLWNSSVHPRGSFRVRWLFPPPLPPQEKTPEPSCLSSVAWERGLSYIWLALRSCSLSQRNARQERLRAPKLTRGKTADRRRFMQGFQRASFLCILGRKCARICRDAASTHSIVLSECHFQKLMESLLRLRVYFGAFREPFPLFSQQL